MNVIGKYSHLLAIERAFLNLNLVVQDSKLRYTFDAIPSVCKSQLKNK